MHWSGHLLPPGLRLGALYRTSIHPADPIAVSILFKQIGIWSGVEDRFNIPLDFKPYREADRLSLFNIILYPVRSGWPDYLRDL